MRNQHAALRHCIAACCWPLPACCRAPALPIVVVSRFSSNRSGKPVAISVTCTSPVYLHTHRSSSRRQQCHDSRPRRAVTGVGMTLLSCMTVWGSPRVSRAG